MTTWALVPIKPRALCKTRLASVLSAKERDRLVRALLLHVVGTLRATPGIDRVVVVSSEGDDLPDDVALLPDDVNGLNASLERSMDAAVAAGASLLLMVPADLPLLRAEQVGELLSAARDAGIVIAPDRHGEGTNALCMRPELRLRMQLGTGSFASHRRQAFERLGHEAECLRQAGLGFDLDTPEDWRWLAREHPQLARVLTGTARESPLLPEELLVTPLDELMVRAQRMTLAGHGRLVSYSRKVFIPLTQLCRDVCHYCTFAKAPRTVRSPYLALDEVLQIARAGAAAGCKEALFTLGDQPEKRYSVARQALEKMGYETTLDYLEAAAKLVFEQTGLLPHLNPGVLSDADLAKLRRVSVSMGLMLETAAERLSLRGGPHWGSPDKHPAVRLATLRAAGQRQIPFTTGLLIGIGETRRERLESLLAIRDLHAEHGHIQEIIVQNFCAKPGTKMARAPEPELEEQLWTIAATRLLFGPQMSVQAPPNLRPGALSALVRAGINDWGGVSPITPDHVNPEAPWPHLEDLRAATEAADRDLVERLAIAPAYARSPDLWLDPALRASVRRATDATGLARTEPWRAGAGHPVPPEAAAWLGPKRPRTELLATARIVERARRGEPLGEDEIVTLFAARGRELEHVLHEADRLRQEMNGDAVTFVVNRNINYTNICTYKCGFCAFSKGRSARNLRGPGYRLDLDEIVRRTLEARAAGATEVCLQGGIHPSYTGETYLEILAAIKSSAPAMHVHAFSPLEVTHGARTLGLSLSDYLGRLRSAGLASLPGTAAEILDDEVRAQICADKIDTAQWLRVMRSAHQVGLRSTATIMFGHTDHPRHWARHLLRLRALQQDTGGFTEFVPLPFVHMEAPMWRKGLARSGPTYREAVMMHAIARLALHPLIRNIQTSWVKMGREGAAFCLRSGANDAGGTLMNESITRAAGGQNGQEMTAEHIATLAAEIGRPARQRTTFYGVPDEGARLTRARA
ncbi:MAG TPA: 5-amino-6-(D-ribitylamino)uracil--L-tyrosine 4-hydroxyphenyl transferase CofH [Steroidobacteraceae bacterium]|nr:5-amino-6-(D-ribitylamino)uracil--L-tyrosine 4-hydroxyphenyl transferase CofH [Steroidobacteraceae bacterium]